MPKLKTHRGAAKRFKKTGTGKIKRTKAFRRGESETADELFAPGPDARDTVLRRRLFVACASALIVRPSLQISSRFGSTLKSAIRSKERAAAELTSGIVTY